MMECCCVTYQKYINEDDTIDYDKINSLAGEMRDSGWSETQIERWLGRNCHCDCHKKGMEVMH